MMRFIRFISRIIPPFKARVSPESTNPPPMGTTGTRCLLASRMICATSSVVLGMTTASGTAGGMVPGSME